MYKILVFLAICILSLCEPHHRSRNKNERRWKNNNYKHKDKKHNDDWYNIYVDDGPEKMFKIFSEELMNTDRNYQKICSERYDNITRVIYDTTDIKIITPLAEYTEEDIIVKIRHRAILIKAKHDGDKSLTFAEVRILPEFVDVYEASWIFAKEVLIIVIPYKVSLGTPSTMSCPEVEKKFNRGYLNIPQKVISIEERLRIEPSVSNRRGE